MYGGDRCAEVWCMCGDGGEVPSMCVWGSIERIRAYDYGGGRPAVLRLWGRAD